LILPATLRGYHYRQLWIIAVFAGLFDTHIESQQAAVCGCARVYCCRFSFISCSYERSRGQLQQQTLRTDSPYGGCRLSTSQPPPLFALQC